MWMKVVAKKPTMQFVAIDWLKSNKCEDHLTSHTSNLVQQLFANQAQFPSCLHGSSQKHFFDTNTCYFEMRTFCNQDDAYMYHLHFGS
jgi:hypothetical protein